MPDGLSARWRPAKRGGGVAARQGHRSLGANPGTRNSEHPAALRRDEETVYLGLSTGAAHRRNAGPREAGPAMVNEFWPKSSINEEDMTLAPLDVSLRFVRNRLQQRVRLQKP